MGARRPVARTISLPPDHQLKAQDLEYVQQFVQAKRGLSILHHVNETHPASSQIGEVGLPQPKGFSAAPDTICQVVDGRLGRRWLLLIVHPGSP
jgi:hypothetical protein